ncbi:MAG TPA: PD-(D/E)XK nuclease family protein, partial [Bryobacteraceae bacterium]|nr:PD-(D/E)XK nuclease family protein [Bryobacteraceae bacterium]
SAPAAELAIEPCKPDGQYDSSAAVTSVALFHACPRKCYLSRYLGLQEENRAAWDSRLPSRGRQEAVLLGVQVHAALAGAAVESGEAMEFVARFQSSELGQRAERAARREREFDFLLALQDVVLRGQIDLWFEEAGELILVDYKTDRDESGFAEYALQLRLYALALERYAGRLPDRAVLCYLRSRAMRDVSLTPADLESARLAVRAFALAQNSLEFPMKEGEQCRRCSFFGGSCPAKKQMSENA